MLLGMLLQWVDDIVEMLLFVVDVDPVKFLFFSLTVVLSNSLSLNSFFKESLRVDIIFFTYFHTKSGIYDIQMHINCYNKIQCAMYMRTI